MAATSDTSRFAATKTARFSTINHHYLIKLLHTVLINKLPRPHKVDKNPPKSRVGFKSLDIQIPEIEDIILQRPGHTMHIPQENNPIILHEHVFLFGPQLEIVALRVVLLFSSNVFNLAKVGVLPV